MTQGIIKADERASAGESVMRIKLFDKLHQKNKNKTRILNARTAEGQSESWANDGGEKEKNN